ncbi:MAG: CheR family methyltransferase [Bacteroidota bacterium]
MNVDVKDIKPFLLALKEESDYDFTNYSMNSLNRRILKIMNDFRIDFDELVERVKEDENFREKVVKKITVHTTDLFRDADLWLYLREKVIPRYAHKKKIFIWHPGCSTGQEVYSMMILLNEMNLLKKTEIYGTDLNPDVLEISRKGEYKFIFNKNYVSNFDAVINPGKSKAKVNHKKYFEINEDKDIIVMKDFLKRKPHFKRMNLVTENNPFKQNFDIIVCRNVIIYFNYDLQNTVFSRFFNSLNEKGCLVLGAHETIIGTYASYFIKEEKVNFKKTDSIST